MPSRMGLGVEFEPGLQEGFIEERGSDMIHEIGVACPHCRTADVSANLLRDGQYQTRSPNCPRCGGDGWLYRDPVVVRGLATSIRQQNNVIDVGTHQPGDMQFSIGPGFFGCNHNGAPMRHVALDDKFTATWAQPLNDGQTIVRGAATMDENLRLSPGLTTDEDRLWYEPVYSLWCEDDTGKQYLEDGDFVFGPGRVIRWVGNRPQVGQRYVVKYTAYFEWLVWAPPQERVDRDNVDLGPLVFLRKRHVAYVNDSLLITSADRIPLSKRVSC